MWWKRTVLAFVTCAAVAGCDQTEEAARRSQAENLALFETSEERCWRYLGNILRKFKVAGACKDIPVRQGPAPQNAEAGDSTGLSQLWNQEIQELKKEVVREEVLGQGYENMIKYLDEKKDFSNMAEKEEGGKYKTACEDSFGTVIRSSIKSMRSVLCTDELLDSFCGTYSGDFFKFKQENQAKGREKIYLNMIKSSVFENHFMAACLLVSPDDTKSLAGKLLRKAKDKAKKEAEKKIVDFLQNAKEKTKEKLKDPETWKFVAKVAVTVVVAALI
ncbi:MAG: hypothetical protein AAF471_00380 [Myxococcota bacterium]